MGVPGIACSVKRWWLPTDRQKILVIIQIGEFCDAYMAIGRCPVLNNDIGGYPSPYMGWDYFWLTWLGLVPATRKQVSLFPISLGLSIRRGRRCLPSKSRHIKQRLAKNRTWPSARPSNRIRARFNHLVFRNSIIFDMANLISAVCKGEKCLVCIFCSSPYSVPERFRDCA